MDVPQFPERVKRLQVMHLQIQSPQQRVRQYLDTIRKYFLHV